MEIYHSIESLPKIVSGSTLTIGTFDGMHQGHNFLISKMVSKSKENRNTSVMITFSPNPCIVVNNISKSKYHLLSKNEKYKAIEALGVDIVLDLDFNSEMSRVSAEDFLCKYIITPFNPTDIIIGYDHHFGYQREGDADFLNKNKNKYNYQLNVADGFQVKGETVSSSKIRAFLNKGEVLNANNFIGGFYKLRAEVVSGEERGREIGFPTANLKIDSISQIIPCNGVYAIKVKIGDKKYEGMCNIGFNPTVSDIEKLYFEVHIFDYNNFNLYGKYIDIEFVDYVRSEIKFDNLELLKAQLIKDKKYCESL